MNNQNLHFYLFPWLDKKNKNSNIFGDSNIYSSSESLFKNTDYEENSIKNESLENQSIVFFENKIENINSNKVNNEFYGYKDMKKSSSVGDAEFFGKKNSE